MKVLLEVPSDGLKNKPLVLFVGIYDEQGPSYHFPPGLPRPTPPSYHHMTLVLRLPFQQREQREETIAVVLMSHWVSHKSACVSDICI